LHPIKKNNGGATVEISASDLAEIADVLAKVPVKGERYDEDHQSLNHSG